MIVPSLPWLSDWVRLHLVMRDLLALHYTPEVKIALDRWVHVRWGLIRAGTFN